MWDIIVKLVLRYVIALALAIALALSAHGMWVSISPQSPTFSSYVGLVILCSVIAVVTTYMVERFERRHSRAEVIAISIAIAALLMYCLILSLSV